MAFERGGDALDQSVSAIAALPLKNRKRNRFSPELGAGRSPPRACKICGMESSSVLTLFTQSLLIGLSIAAPVGQIGVLAIQRTVDHGRAAGLATGLGAAIADAVYGAIGAFGVTTLIAWLLGIQTWLALFGSAFLLWLAWRIVTRPVAPRRNEHPPAGTLLRYVSGTFVLTLSNPPRSCRSWPCSARWPGARPPRRRGRWCRACSSARHCGG